MILTSDSSTDISVGRAIAGTTNHCPGSRASSRCSKRLIMVVCCAVSMMGAGRLDAFQWVDPPKVPDGSTARVIKQFLTSDWERDFDNRSNASQTYTSTSNPGPGVSLAYALNRMQHNQMREAEDVVTQLTKRSPEVIDGWILKSWLNALLDNFERSLIDLRSVKKRLVAKPELTGKQKLEVYRRLGKLIGYMQGPVSDKVDPDLLQQTLVFLANGCSAEELTAFNDSRDSVLTRYEALLESQNQKTQVELEKQQLDDQNLEVTLNRQNQLLEQRQQQLASEKERIRMDGNQRIAELTNQLSPLEQQLVAATDNIAVAQQDLQFLYVDLNNVLATPPRFRTISPAYLSNQIRLREFDLFNFQADRNSIFNQIELVRGQINRTRNEYNAQLAQIDREYKQVSNSQRRNLIKLGKIATGPEIADGKVGAMTSRLNALSSYDDLSVELYRQQMLDLLPKQ